MAPREETAPLKDETATSEPVPLARGTGGGDGGDSERGPTPVRPSVIRPAESAGRAASMVIEAVTPELDGGRSAVKRVAGDPLHVEADIFKEGHDVLAAVVWWRQVSPGSEAGPWRACPMHPLGNDRWVADVTLGPPGRVVFTIEAWPDLYRSWVAELERKVAVGRDVRSELLEGAALLRACAARADAAHATHDAQLLDEAASVLEGPPMDGIGHATETRVVDAAARYPDRSIGRRDPLERPVLVERDRARAGAWYELFPRSAAHAERHGTFRDVEGLLPEIERLGFDVLYLPPIHPIGRTARKGKNNAPKAGPADVGSPWAIGAREGGHTAVHPELGTLDDFRRLVGRAAEHGLEVALDLAYQVSPDNPWVTEHPEWFQHRPDGTIKTAENPPKRYDDIVNFDFLGPGRTTLWPALLEVVLFWAEQGVRIFRVDNPHTKPLPFWEWMLREARERDPGLIFLSEAFTRPKLMRALAKVGFSQSYTYFTWRNHKHELTEYFEELRRPEWANAMRPNLWPNTPDILPEFLQRGGPPAFRIRVVLAATLGASYGIYSGYEFCDAGVLQGEEYRDSEKYQLVDWRIRRSGDIREWIRRLNEIRHAEPALQSDDGLQFFECDDSQVISYGKRTEDGASQVLVAVSLDPYRTHTAELQLPLQRYGLAGREVVEGEERLCGARLLGGGETATVTLTPEMPAAVWTVRAPARTEQAFDYFY
jgi:starch synthase (maltosyl-transferring)